MPALGEAMGVESINGVGVILGEMIFEFFLLPKSKPIIIIKKTRPKKPVTGQNIFLLA